MSRSGCLGSGVRTMLDMYGNEVPLGAFLELKRGNHEFLSGFFPSNAHAYGVVQVGSYYIERQIHGDNERYAVYAPDKWENAEKYRLSKGFERRETVLWK